MTGKRAPVGIVIAALFASTLIAAAAVYLVADEPLLAVVALVGLLVGDAIAAMVLLKVSRPGRRPLRIN